MDVYYTKDKFGASEAYFIAEECLKLPFLINRCSNRIASTSGTHAGDTISYHPDVEIFMDIPELRHMLSNIKIFRKDNTLPTDVIEISNSKLMVLGKPITERIRVDDSK